MNLNATEGRDNFFSSSSSFSISSLVDSVGRGECECECVCAIARHNGEINKNFSRGDIFRYRATDTPVIFIWIYSVLLHFFFLRWIGIYTWIEHTVVTTDDVFSAPSIWYRGADIDDCIKNEEREGRRMGGGGEMVRWRESKEPLVLF